MRTLLCASDDARCYKVSENYVDISTSTTQSFQCRISRQELISLSRSAFSWTYIPFYFATGQAASGKALEQIPLRLQKGVLSLRIRCLHSCKLWSLSTCNLIPTPHPLSDMAGVDAANRPRCMGRQHRPRASRKARKGTCLNLLPPLLALSCMTVFTKFRISQSSCRARWYLIKRFFN